MQERVLIVDDEVIIGLGLVRSLNRHGYDAVAVASSAACLQYLQDNGPPDLILMDMNLGAGEIDGAELMRRIQQSHDVPIVVHTAYADRETLSSTEELPTYGYVHKTPGNNEYLLATMRMAMTLHNTEQELRARERMYHDLLHHLQSLREEYAVRLAQEIHDDLGQSLAAMSMNVARLATLATPELTAQNPEWGQTLTTLRSILQQTTTKTRTIIRGLRPPTLDTDDLFEALRWHTLEFGRTFGITARFVADGPAPPLPDATAISVFRIVQESLTNVARHAAAQQVEVSAAARSDRVELLIRDDGSGFSPTHHSGHGRFGLMGMQERAAQIDATLDVTSAPGGGTSVALSVPLLNALPGKNP